MVRKAAMVDKTGRTLGGFMGNRLLIIGKVRYINPELPRKLAFIEHNTLKADNPLKHIKSCRQQARDLQFEDMMADSECELYQRCYELLKPMQRKRSPSPMFEAAMKSAFNGLMGHGR